MLTDFALRGGKRGLGLILVSQRSAKLAKDVLTQASSYFLHRVIHPIDLAVYKDLIPLEARKVESLITGLGVGQAIYVNGQTVEAVAMRRRSSFDSGATPTMQAEAAPELRRIDASLLAQLQAIAPKAVSSGESRRAQGLTAQIAELTQQLAEREQTCQQQAQEIEQLRRELALVSQLKVVVERISQPSSNGAAPQTLHIQQATIEEMYTNLKSQEPDNDAVAQKLKVLAEGLAMLSEAVAPPASLAKSSHQKPAAPVKSTSPGKAHLAAPRLPAVLPTTAQAAVAELRQSLSRGEAQHLEQLIKLICASKKQQREIFVTLALEEENSGRGLNVQQLKNRLPSSYKLSNLVTNQPYDLIRAGLIRKEGTGKAVTYYSNLSEYLTMEFAGVEPGLIRAKLLNALRP